MKMQISKEAKEKLMAEKKEGQFLYLKYDSDDCGCATDGIFYLLLTNEAPKEHDILIETDDTPLYVSTQITIYLAEEMKLSYNRDTLTYRLSSKEEIMNARMRLRK